VSDVKGNHAKRDERAEDERPFHVLVYVRCGSSAAVRSSSSFLSSAPLS